MSESVLTMNQVEKRYKNVPVLQDITMDIPRGSIYGLVGSNGAGKSTLMRLISGQTRIDRGEIRLFGKIPEKKEQRVRRRIGTLIEEPGFYGDLSARQNLGILPSPVRDTGKGNHIPAAGYGGAWKYREKEIQEFFHGNEAASWPCPCDARRP